LKLSDPNLKLKCFRVAETLTLSAGRIKLNPQRRIPLKLRHTLRHVDVVYIFFDTKYQISI
jgi:hypothetical protein